jgi:hypothetical protein
MSLTTSPTAETCATTAQAQCAGKGSHDYGAIAYSRRTGATGWSKNRDTREEAETDALENCDATNCEVRVFTGGNLLNQTAVFEESAKKLDY